MPPFLYAFIGGLALNLIQLAELYRIPKMDRPETFRDPLYYAQLIGLPAIGGFLVYAYEHSGTMLSPILAINVGASAPAILKSLSKQVHHDITGPQD